MEGGTRGRGIRGGVGVGGGGGTPMGFQSLTGGGGIRGGGEGWEYDSGLRLELE